ncbi:MAG: hypothetical protein ACREBB_00375 [Nitrosotalea sp.]
MNRRTSPSARNLVLMIFIAVSISAVFLIPQHAFSTVTLIGYPNDTTTTQPSNSTGTSTSSSTTTGSTSTTQPSNSTGTSTSSSTTLNSTARTLTSNTNSSSTQSNSTVVNQTNTRSSTNSTQSYTTGITQSSSNNQTASTGTSNATNTTSTQSTQSSESSSPTPAPVESSPVISEPSSGSIGESSPVITSSEVTSSASNESVVSPSIVISGLNDSIINSTNTNSSIVYSTTVYTGVPILPSSLLLTNDQSYYAYGDVVTLKVALPGIALQNIAIVVADPTGNDIVSRTVTTDANGTGELQFKIPSNFQTGVYQDIATALVGGKNYTNSTQFNVIKTHGILIDSVQLTDQQGNPVSMIKQGQNNFVQVSISSGETIPVLLTLNMFDANQSSIGTASVNSTINPGDTQTTLSFFIPQNSQVGTADIFTDAFSNWPSDGGTPLTPESCLSASLENPTALPVSYQPTPPQSCTQRPQNLIGTTLVSNTASTMTNNQAMVTLGVSIQNDTMTFMSPAKAQLLALAYQNGTATNTGANSIALVNLNLAALNSTGTFNATGGNATQFTTLVGPALQNDPMAQKILQEIQISKQQVANIIGNQTAATINANLVQQQRVAAASQLKQDLTALEQANAVNTPSAQYSSFLATIPDNATQGVFEGEFNFMQQRIAAANAAMQNVLSNGGSLDQAMQTFDSYAAINHAQIVQMNNNLNVEYGLANANVQSCFDSNGDLAVVNNTNPCLANMENHSTNPTGIQILSVQPTDQNGNPVSTFTRGQSGYVKVSIYSGYSALSLVTIDLFDSSLNTLGTGSVKYTLSPGNSEVVLPYYVPTQSSTGLASIYANVLTDWPNSGGTSETHELSYFVGLL